MRFVFVIVLALAAGLRADEGEGDARAGAAAAHARLQALGATVFPAVVEHFGLPEGTTFPVRFATLDEVRLAVASDVFFVWSHEIEGLGDVPERAAELIEEAEHVSAIYSSSEGRILVVEPQVRRFVQAGFDEDTMLRVVLLHEAAHAALYATHVTRGMLSTIDTLDELRAFGAVLEGHAQYVSRTLAPALGLQGAFESFTAELGFTLPSGDARETYLTTVAHAETQARYSGGERFVRAVVEAGGDDAVERLFAALPRDLAAVERPEWYLDPERRPVSRFEFESALDVLRAVLGEARSVFEGPLARADLAAWLALLPELDVARALDGLVAQRALLAWGTDEGREGSHSAVWLAEFGDPSLARDVVARLLRAGGTLDTIDGFTTDRGPRDGGDALRVSWSADDGDARLVLMARGPLLAASFSLGGAFSARMSERWPALLLDEVAQQSPAQRKR